MRVCHGVHAGERLVKVGFDWGLERGNLLKPLGLILPAQPLLVAVGLGWEREQPCAVTGHQKDLWVSRSC